MHQRRITIGLLGIVGIWLTAGIALPFVNVLSVFSPGQLMAFRGCMTALIALALLRGHVMKVDKYTYLIGITVPLATLGLFEGIRYWGAGPTIIIVTATPLVNLAIGLFSGKRISSAVIIGLCFVIGGVLLASGKGIFNIIGLSWSVFATIMSGLIYECFARAQSKPLQKCFWGSIGMGILGLLFSAHDSWKALVEPDFIILIVSFSFIGGFLYWIANLVAFENLPTTEASVLAQGETIAVIIGAHILLGEHLNLPQWIGVVIALYGAGHLAYCMSRQKAVLEKDTT